MKIIPCVQGDATWIIERLGRPTASHFAELITPATLKPSKQSRGYRLQKLAEWGLNQPCESFKSGFTARGQGLEAEAVAAYERETLTAVQRVGLCLTDDELVAASPDGLIGDNGGIEVKIVAADNHLDRLLSPPDMNEHKAQINGNMFVCERKWWIRWYWHPKFPGLAVRFERDETYIDAIKRALYDEDDGFLVLLEQDKQRLMELGFDPTPPCQCMTENGVCGSRDAVTDQLGVWMCAKHVKTLEEIFG